MMDPPLSAVILSAGFSSRMGRLKPLLPLGGKTVIERVVSLFMSDNVKEVVVVTGYRAAEVGPIAESAGARVVDNLQYREGMFSSVKTGVKNIDPESRAFFVMPVDIALVRPLTIDLICSAYRKNRGKIIYPVFAHNRGHPPLIPAFLAPAILESRKEGGLRAFLRNYEKLAIDLPVPDRNILMDMDFPGKYEDALESVKNHDTPTPEECEVILTDTNPVSEQVLHHSRRVEKLASAICLALREKGEELDAKLVTAASLLHDIAKSEKNHAENGEKMLCAMGFHRVAKIVAEHMDLRLSESAKIEESHIIFIADKMVMNENYVSISRRFKTAFQRFDQDPDASLAIEKRIKTAEWVKTKIENRLGRPLESFFE